MTITLVTSTIHSEESVVVKIRLLLCAFGSELRAWTCPSALCPLNIFVVECRRMVLVKSQSVNSNSLAWSPLTMQLSPVSRLKSYLLPSVHRSKWGLKTWRKTKLLTLWGFSGVVQLSPDLWRRGSSYLDYLIIKTRTTSLRRPWYWCCLVTVIFTVNWT